MSRPLRKFSGPPRPPRAVRRWWWGIEDRIWDEAHENNKGPVGFFWRWVQILASAARGLYENNDTLRASALTYKTILSFVPMLAVVFSILKALGFRERLEERLLERFAAGSESQVEETVSQLSEFISRTSAVNLGGVGVIALLLISISLLSTVEEALNVIWGQRHGRGFLRRTSDYLTLIIVGPIFVVSGLYMTTALQGALPGEAPPAMIAAPAPAPRTSGPPAASETERATLPADAVTSATAATLAEDNSTTAALAAVARRGFSLLPDSVEQWVGGHILRPAFKILPFLAIWLMFIFIYIYIPNTSVRWSSAVVGGILGGTLWQLAQVAYVQYSVKFLASKYNVIYGAFAWALILLVWVYFSWLILLLGAELACAHQTLADRRRRRRAWRGTPAEKETLALRVAALLARPMLAPVASAPGAATLADLADELRISPAPIEDMLDLFSGAGLVARDQDSGGWLFKRSPEVVSALDLLRLARRGEAAAEPPSASGAMGPLSEALTSALAGIKLASFAGQPLDQIQTFSISGDEPDGGSDEGPAPASGPPPDSPISA